MGLRQIILPAVPSFRGMHGVQSTGQLYSTWYITGTAVCVGTAAVLLIHTNGEKRAMITKPSVCWLYVDGCHCAAFDYSKKFVKFLGNCLPPPSAVCRLRNSSIRSYLVAVASEMPVPASFLHALCPMCLPSAVPGI